MDSIKYDGFLFGNGLTINFFQNLKPKVPLDKESLLNIYSFLVEFSESKNKEIDNYIFKLLYQDEFSNRKNFQKLKQEIKRYYISGGNSNIEYEFGKYLFLQGNATYDYSLMMSLFPYLYNIWYNIVCTYLTNNFESDIKKYYKSVKIYLKETSHVITTNFDKYAEFGIDNIQHIHGEFVELTGLDDLNYSVKNGKIEYKTIWGHNGTGKQEAINARKHNKLYNFRFFYDNTMEIENLLIYGLGFRRSAYITEEFLKRFPQHRHNYCSEIVIDGHILERLSVLQRNKKLDNITMTYFSDEELQYFRRLIDFHKLKNVEFRKCIAFNFHI